MILPYIEQQALYKRFDLSKYISARRQHRGPQPGNLATMLCPSDHFNQQPFSVPDGLGGENWARGNYGANSSLSHAKLAATSPSRLANLKRRRIGMKRTGLGLAGSWAETSLCRSRQIEDGTSNTILLTELRAGLSQSDRRGIWAMGMAGASSVWAHSTDDCIGPNSCKRAPTTSGAARPLSERRANPRCCRSAWASAAAGPAAIRRRRGACTLAASRGLRATAASHLSRENIETHHGDFNIAYDTDGYRDYGAWEKIMCSSDGGIFNRNEF